VNSNCFCRVIFSLMVLVACMVFSGCFSNSGPTMHAVRGKLTHNGRPIAEMMVCFEPVDGDRNPASSAVTNSHGEFELKVGNTLGVAPGEYIVYVQDPVAVMGGRTSTEPSYLQVLETYGERESSEMRITIKEATYDYELKLD